MGAASLQMSFAPAAVVDVAAGAAGRVSAETLCVDNDSRAFLSGETSGVLWSLLASSSSPSTGGV
jgi:hypothetical protein